MTGSHEEVGIEAVHQFCFAETFQKEDLQNLDNLWEESEVARASHKTCRNERVTACVGGKVESCEAYDNYRWYDPRARLEHSQCKMFQNDPASANFNSEIVVSHAEVFSAELAATDDRKVNNMEACLRDTKSWLEDLYTYYKNCNRQGTDACLKKREECDVFQHDFEVARCWWAVDHDYHCRSYEHCVKNRLTACVGVCEDLSTYLASTKRDYKTGETIQCLLEALFGQYNTNYDPNLRHEIAADTAKEDIDARAWPLTPRGETDKEKEEWLQWCKGKEK